MRSLFHLAYHVNDLEAARQFYGSVLGCKGGRSTETWIDFEIPPAVQIIGEPGEQHTMFFCGPSENQIEIKGFSDFEGVFAT
ncbi:MAG: hypothetical protein GY947_07195 [Rhodobacteraceae bacterium]|nr:hypothetical protein [Paracoccaceae bacterium]